MAKYEKEITEMELERILWKAKTAWLLDQKEKSNKQNKSTSEEISNTCKE